MWPRSQQVAPWPGPQSDLSDGPPGEAPPPAGQRSPVLDRPVGSPAGLGWARLNPLGQTEARGGPSGAALAGSQRWEPQGGTAAGPHVEQRASPGPPPQRLPPLAHATAVGSSLAVPGTTTRMDSAGQQRAALEPGAPPVAARLGSKLGAPLGSPAATGLSSSSSNSRLWSVHGAVVAPGAGSSAEERGSEERPLSIPAANSPHASATAAGSSGSSSEQDGEQEPAHPSVQAPALSRKALQTEFSIPAGVEPAEADVEAGRAQPSSTEWQLQHGSGAAICSTGSGREQGSEGQLARPALRPLAPLRKPLQLAVTIPAAKQEKAPAEQAGDGSPQPSPTKAQLLQRDPAGGSSFGSNGDKSGLPIALPFDPPSWVCMALDRGHAPRFAEYVFSTPFWMDLLLAMAALMSAITTLFLSVLKEVSSKSNSGLGGMLLTLFSLFYPLATMSLLTLRANEVSVRKEVYFLLLRYKLVLDWQNWAYWAGNPGTKSIPKHSQFFRYWLFTLGVLMYWAWWQANYWNMLVVVLLQCSYVWRYHQSTLWVEQSVLSFNKSLENREGLADFRAAHAYLTSGLATVSEGVLRRYANWRWLQLPGPRRGLLRRANPQYNEKLQAWREAAAGDLAHLPEADKSAFRLGWWQQLVTKHLWGYCMLKVISEHPDFAAANQPARLYLRGKKLPLVVGLAVVLGIEFYGVWYQINTLAGSTVVE